MQIGRAERSDAMLLASLVSKSNQDVAGLLNLNIDNAPKHPSFCTSEWILSDIDRGQEYFISTENGVAKGCVAFEQPDDETAYLNRLSVLPEFRNMGIGSSLVQHIIEYARERKVKNISIGTIAEHNQLKDWYLNIGFIEGAIKKFDHLPFNVLYMKYKI